MLDGLRFKRIKRKMSKYQKKTINIHKNARKNGFLQKIKNRGINQRQRPQRTLSFSKKILGGHGGPHNTYNASKHKEKYQSTMNLLQKNLPIF